MSFLTKLCKLFKPKAEFKTGYISELDKFYHGYNKQRKDWLSNPLRVQEMNKHEAIFDKRDNPVEKKAENLWKDF